MLLVKCLIGCPNAAELGQAEGSREEERQCAERDRWPGSVVMEG